MLSLGWVGLAVAAAEERFPVDACANRAIAAHRYPVAKGGPAGRPLTPTELRALARYNKMEGAAWAKCASLATAGSREPSIEDPKVLVEISAHDEWILTMALAASYLNMAGAYIYAAGDKAEGRAAMAQALQRMVALTRLQMSDTTRRRHLDGYIADAKQLAANVGRLVPTTP
jgi:hypothetical protein